MLMNLESSGESRIPTPNLFHQFNPFEKLASSKRQQLKGDLRYLKTTYGLKIVMGRLNPSDDPDLAWINKLTLSQAVRAVRVVREEVSKYPPEYLQYGRIEHIRLVRSFFRSRSGWLSGWAPYLGGYDIYLSTDQNGNFPDRGVIHHEIFHVSDFSGFDDHLRQTTQDKIVQPIIERHSAESYLAPWLLLNPRGSEHYLMTNSRYNAFLRRHNIRDGTNPIQGFARVYGLKDPWEDRATVAQLLMTKPKEAEKRQRQDSVLRNKLNEILRQMAERSGGRMTGRFLDDLISGRVKAGYWIKKLPN